MTKNKKYLAIFFITIITLASSIFIFNVRINPLGIVPASLSFIASQEVKMARGDRDRLYRAFDPFIVKPEIVFLGSSRLNRTIDPKLVTALTGKRCYIAGLNGGSYQELAYLLGQWLSRGVPIKEVVLDIYFWRIILRPDNTITPYKFSLFGDLLSKYFSSQTINASLDTLLFKRANITPHHFNAHGYLEPVLLPRGPGSLAGNFGPWSYNVESLYAKAKDSDLQPIRDIYALCQKYGVKFRMILGPIDPYRLSVYLLSGRLGLLMDMKKSLAQIAPFIDFSFYDKSVYHPYCAGSEAWLDPGHFSSHTGKRIIDRLYKHPPPSTGGGLFGVMIDSKNVDEKNRIWEKDIRRWLSDNPRFEKIYHTKERRFECR